MTPRRSLVAAVALACLAATGVAFGGEFVPVPDDSAEDAQLGTSVEVMSDDVTATFTHEGGSGLCVAGKAGKQIGLGVSGNKANAINVGETVIVTFDQDVTLRQIDFGYVGAEDHVVVTIAGADGEMRVVFGGEADTAELPKGVKIHKNFRFAKFNAKAAVTIPAGSEIRITSESSVDNTFFVKSLTADAGGA